MLVYHQNVYIMPLSVWGLILKHTTLDIARSFWLLSIHLQRFVLLSLSFNYIFVFVFIYYSYQFPSMQQIGEDLIHVLDHLKFVIDFISCNFIGSASI